MCENVCLTTKWCLVCMGKRIISNGSESAVGQSSKKAVTEGQGELQSEKIENAVSTLNVNECVYLVA